MSRHLGWFFLAVLMLAVSAPLQALTYEVGGCKTGKSYVNFTTISAAVIGVPAGSTIEVCPGVYSEQVTITQPLTLKGIAFNNANRSVITINNPTGGPLTPNVTSLVAGPTYAQVLVQNVIPPGPVDIIGITVDGSGAGAACLTLAGIYYNSASGALKEVTTRQQLTEGCTSGGGNGIWLENDSGPSQTVSVENSSVHDFYEFGIQAISEQFPPTLTTSLQQNSVTNFPNSTFSHRLSYGITIEGADAAIIDNFVTGGGNNAPYSQFQGIGAYPDANMDIGNMITVSGNTVADLVPAQGFGTGIYLYKQGYTGQSNKISNVSSTGLLATFATVKSNIVMNTAVGYTFTTSCLAGNTVSGNSVNDSPVAFSGLSLAEIQPNHIYNADTVEMGCP